MRFSPSSVPLKQRWRNNGLSADFMADYMTTFFPGNERVTAAINKKEEIKGAVGYIANELLENAMKFNDEKSSYTISIQLHMNSDSIIFVTRNSIAQEAVESFILYIKELVTGDPEELYIRQLEENAEDVACSISKLGYLTMINDYGAKLGWKFETVHQELEVTTVTTMVQLTV
ncbi:MAG: ATP-binding protein [Oscillatoria sp. PMC 1051.18]|nr:ATP-binding protein [Oscillatoria sp. PMC 1050.18]MEC5032696.1 ATP-binding protein [Oscillatoria sp. PMC 1051.18]